MKIALCLTFLARRYFQKCSTEACSTPGQSPFHSMRTCNRREISNFADRMNASYEQLRETFFFAWKPKPRRPKFCAGCTLSSAPPYIASWLNKKNRVTGGYGGRGCHDHCLRKSSIAWMVSYHGSHVFRLPFNLE